MLKSFNVCLLSFCLLFVPPKLESVRNRRGNFCFWIFPLLDEIRRIP
jgi:hypothetical protein